jgi:NADH dehydrogenase
VKASPFGDRLADATGAETDDSGRLPVGSDLSPPGHPEILVLGDLARFEHEHRTPLPGVAQVAVQQGRHAARVIRARQRGRAAPAFQYRNRGQMATIGRAAAVAEIGRLRFAGYPAWLLWLVVHLLQLVQFDDRMLVATQWAWNYTTWNRSARLIAGGCEPSDSAGGPPRAVDRVR